MAKAVITVINCTAGKLEFPGRIDQVEVPNTAAMTIIEAKDYAFKWASKHGRKVARVEVKIVYGQDGM